MAGPAWDQLTPEEKDRYKDGAKNAVPIVNKNRKRYNCLGEDLEEVNARAKQQREGYTGMIEEINDLLPDTEQLDDTVLYFISTEYFYSDGNKVYPAEIALAKFSLRKGIIDDIQIRLNPGTLPLGAPGCAKERAKAVGHQYPLPPFAEGEKDPLNILEAIIKFLHPLKELPIFFAQGNTRDDKTTLENTCKIVDAIFRDAGEDEIVKSLSIYPIDELFFALNRKAVANMNRLSGTDLKPFASISYASEKFNIDEFRYFAKTCTFHSVNETPSCCLSIVRRFCYTISKWCADKNRYPMVEGKHKPDGFE